MGTGMRNGMWHVGGVHERVFWELRGGWICVCMVGGIGAAVVVEREVIWHVHV